MIRKADEDKVWRRFGDVRRELRSRIADVARNYQMINSYYVNIFVHQHVSGLDTVAGRWPLAKFVREKMYEIARSVGRVPLDANEVWKLFRSSIQVDFYWYDQEIERRLFSVKRELRVRVLAECGDDLIKAEKYYAELVNVEEFENLDTIKENWPSASFLRVRTQDIADSDPKNPLVVARVWHVFRTTFLGRANLCEAEIKARQLLWHLAVMIETAADDPSFTPLEEEAMIAYVASIHHPDGLRAPHQYSQLPSKLSDVLYGYHISRNRKNENVSMVIAEAWHRFRYLLAKYRSQVYTTL